MGGSDIVQNFRRYLVRKLGTLAITVFFVTSLNFFIFQVMPGDPSRILLPRGGGSPTDVTNFTTLRILLTQRWGLDKPLYYRFAIYLWNLAQGDWGTSIVMSPGNDVWTIIVPRLASTLIFTGTATLLSIWLGMRLGLFTGWKRGKFSEITVT